MQSICWHVRRVIHKVIVQDIKCTLEKRFNWYPCIPWKSNVQISVSTGFDVTKSELFFFADKIKFSFYVMKFFTEITNISSISTQRLTN